MMIKRRVHQSRFWTSRSAEAYAGFGASGGQIGVDFFANFSSFFAMKIALLVHWLLSIKVF